MKKIVFCLLLSAASTYVVSAQTTSSDFQKGSIVTANNETLVGSIRDQTKSKGVIQFEASGGKKKIYSPAELSRFTINGSTYVSYASDFYKLIVPAGKAALYQRVTDNSGKMLYNGAEVVSVTTAEGKYGDYYVQKQANGTWVRVTPKDFEASLTNVLSDCIPVVTAIKAKEFDYAKLAQAIEKYNLCQ